MDSKAEGISRKRYTDAFEFRGPDKIPVHYHPSLAGLHVHGQKLLELFKQYPPDNPISFDALPVPKPGTLAKDGSYHETAKDEWGTEWEYMVFGIQGHAKGFPFANWSEAKSYKFPTHWTPQWSEDVRREKFIVSGWASLFQRLYALRPMDEFLMDLQCEEPELLKFLDRMTDYWLEEIELHIKAGSDSIMFGDDLCTQQAPMISPALFRKILKPRYETLFAPIKKAGSKVFFHCCGRLGYVFDELIELGIDGLWAQLSIYQDDEEFLSKCLASRLTLLLHPDRQRLIPRGTPAQIESFVAKCAERYHAAKGGGIFYVEIENDAPFENAEALIKAIHKYR